MAATSPTRGRLRRLAETRPERGRVLSLYIDLDPSQFGTAPARASEIRSTIDEASKRVAAAADLGHEERKGLREDVERLRTALDPQHMAAGGARGMAVFACSPADLLEIVRTPYPLQRRIVIDETPYVEPLMAAGERDRLAVALVSRRTARLFIGDEDHLEEIEEISDDVHGWHDQGGWSQARYQRAIQEDVRDHLDNVSDDLLAQLRTNPFDRLIVGAPEPLDHDLERRLHPYLKERLGGVIRVDVDTANAVEVLAAAAPVFEEHRRGHEREVIERLRAGIARPGGRAAGGLAATLEALNEQRVEVLLLEPNLRGRGWIDPVTGYLAAQPGASPTGGELKEREDIVEDAVERAIDQSAEVLVLRDHPDLGPHGGIAAVLRF